MRVEIFVQARMRSTRLPGKVMLTVLDKPLLGYLIERLQEVQNADAIVILTTTHPADDVIVEYCEKNRIPCYRGPEEDVLTRYFQVAKKRNPDAIVRITADCPLMDPTILEKMIQFYRDHADSYDYISNSLERTYPRGLDIEVFSAAALDTAFQEAKQPFEREHVTPYIYRHPERFRLCNLPYSGPSLAEHRWTVDTHEDFALIRLIIEHLWPQNTHFRLADVLHLLERHPDWTLINAHIQQKPLDSFRK